jgi:hypothetical protein
MKDGNCNIKVMKMNYIDFALKIMFLFFIFSCSVKPELKKENNIIIENDYVSYIISGDGRNLHFMDKVNNKDLLYADTISYCASIILNKKQYNANAVSLKNNILTFGFGNGGINVKVRIQKKENYLKMKVEKVKGNIESLTFLNIPLKLEGMPYEPFAVCVLSMNLFTHVQQLPALQTHLSAICYQKFGLKGAEISLLGVPMENILPEIRTVIKNARDIPFSDKGGAWAKMNKEGYGSYLINFGTLTEESVDEWISKCSNVGFNQIDSHGGSMDFFKFGSFELNPEKWPEGWASFKWINEKLHEAGISHILHTYAFFIDKNSKYITPVPSKDLAYFKSFTLTESVNPEDSVIIVKESTENVSAVTGFHVPNSRTLRIGNELIEFSSVTKTYPYMFKGCKRGFNGTKPSSYNAEDKAYHLKEMFGRFLPGAETMLFNEIARNTAKIVNENNFDGIYFDAIDGSDILDGQCAAWYYGTKFIFEVAKYLEKPVGMEMSTMFHSWWHYRSRWQAWDTPRRGFKKFVDIHISSIKTNEPEHGWWRGDTSLIHKFAPLENGSLFFPFQLGWWLNFTWDPPQTEPTFVDDIEYLCCKMMGNNAGLALLGGVDEEDAKEKPILNRLNFIIKQYEELRHLNYFDDSVRTLLRQPGKEFTLFQQADGNWNFKPVVYNKHKTESNKHLSSAWVVENGFQSQPVRMRIELLMAAKSYDNPDNIVLENFSENNLFNNQASASGVSGTLTKSTEKLFNKESTASFSARSVGKSPQHGSWIAMEKKFDPWLNLGNNQALGVWIKGDGNGELLNFRLETPEQFSAGVRGDHFVKIDFTGWKYFELVEIESSEFTNYVWPGSNIFSNSNVKDLFVYRSYLHSLQFDKIDKLQLWYNNIPENKQVNCLIGPIKALPMVPTSIENPSITINKETIVFPVKMESGMYIEFNSVSDCKLYSSKGEFIKDIPIQENIPILQQGSNNISFVCNGSKEINPRMQVTVISEGAPLEVK